jgi:hypothetical protein
MPRSDFERNFAPVEVWKTKDGRQIPLSEMSDTHVLRTVRLLEARLVTLGLTETSSPIEVVYRRSNIADTQYLLEMIKREADRRKLADWGKFGIGLVKKALLDED